MRNDAEASQNQNDVGAETDQWIVNLTQNNSNETMTEDEETVT